MKSKLHSDFERSLSQYIEEKKKEMKVSKTISLPFKLLSRAETLAAHKELTLSATIAALIDLSLSAIEQEAKENANSNQ
jgi:macrodomain Ter protein organizer (MatP/YcbG family)